AGPRRPPPHARVVAARRRLLRRHVGPAPQPAPAGAVCHHRRGIGAEQGGKETVGSAGRKLTAMPSTPPNPGLLLPTASLCWRELVRFYRQPSRVLGALGTPAVFWLLIGSGIGTSFRAAELPHAHGFLEYFFPGTLLLILLFTSIFCMMSTIADRHQGFLQSVLVAPVSRASLVLGKVLGGTLLAL